MMGPGLARLLDTIKSKPSDSILVDRFLVLAADMPEFERVGAVLRLARTLVDPSPLRALEIAWMVYKSALSDAESLRVMADALRRLGKHNKAERIESEARRVAGEHTTDEVKNLSRLTIEEHMTNAMAELRTPDPIAEGTRMDGSPEITSFFNISEPAASNNNELAVLLAAQREVSKATVLIGDLPDPRVGDQSQLLPLELQQIRFSAPEIAIDPVVAQKVVPPVEEPVVPRDLVANPEPARVADPGPAAEPVLVLSTDSVPLESLPGDGIPVAIPAGQSSRYAKALREAGSLASQDVASVIAEDAHSTPREDFDDAVRPESNPRKKKSNTRASISGTGVAGRREMSLAERRIRLRDLIAAEEWEAVLRFLEHSFPKADDETLLPLFTRNSLWKVDIRYAEWWIDIMIAARQERRALRYVIQQLADEPSLVWARMIWPKISIIRGALNLSDFEWRERDGVAALRDRITAMEPRLGCYWASPLNAS